MVTPMTTGIGTMRGTVRARFKAGALELLEKTNLPEGKEVTVTIIETPTSRSIDGLCRSAGGWKGLIDADRLIENIYNDRRIGILKATSYKLTAKSY